MKKGRPTRYKKEFAEQAYKLCQLGATDNQLADFFGVSEVTINTWKKKHSEFLKSIKNSKYDFDTKIEMSLAQRAMGFSHPDVKVFNNDGTPLVVPITKHYPPDTGACVFWLKNRKPNQWREKVEQEHTGGVQIKVIRE